MSAQTLSRWFRALVVVIFVDMIVLTGLLIYQVYATAHRSTSHFGFIQCVMHEPPVNVTRATIADCERRFP